MKLLMLPICAVVLNIFILAGAYGELSLEGMTLALNFSTKGWVTLKNLVPQLNDSAVQLEIKSSYIKTRRLYVPYAVKHLKDKFNFDCARDASACGNLNMADFGEDNMSIEDMENQAAIGFEYVKCCVELSAK
jgi:hypothetical protein